MPKNTMENIKTINSAARTVLLLACLAGVGYLGWFAYAQWIQPGLEVSQLREVMNQLKGDYEQLQRDYEKQSEELVKTKTALKLVKVDHRKAIIKVLEKGIDDETEEPYFVVEFTEVTPEGNPISEPREFRLRGTLMFIDSWVVKFNDKYIEQADELRSASLCVFKSIWGDLDQRQGGHSLDRTDGEFNTAYGTLDPKNNFEQQIWDDFWELANNPKRQQELGIRANHGEIPYVQVKPGMIYELDLRASDGISLKARFPAKNTSRSDSEG